MKRSRLIFPLVTALMLIGSYQSWAQRFRMEEVDNSLEVVFDAFRVDDKVQFVWNINNEVNIRSYEIRRGRENGRFVDWETITSLNSGGTGSYTFIDENPVLGEMHYRLKLLAPDGSSIEYSPLFRTHAPPPEGTVRVEN